MSELPTEAIKSSSVQGVKKLAKKNVTSIQLQPDYYENKGNTNSIIEFSLNFALENKPEN